MTHLFAKLLFHYKTTLTVALTCRVEGHQIHFAKVQQQFQYLIFTSEHNTDHPLC